MKEFPITEQFESSKVSESNQAKYQEVPKLENLIFFFENPEQNILISTLSGFKILNDATLINKISNMPFLRNEFSKVFQDFRR